MSKASYLDPLALARIENLQLRARTVVEGAISGLHQSPYRGTSLEFAQHREYSSGDELKHIDWKVYGRTDRFFVKQFEEDTNLRVYLLLDCSGSMAFKGEKSVLSKYDYAATVTASIAYLVLHQGDSAGLGTLHESSVKLIPPRSSFSHLNVVLDGLEKVSPAGKTALASSLESIAHSVKKRSLIILVSDLLDETDSVLRAIKFLQFKKHELMIIHLLDSDEKDFPYSGQVRFDSLESDEKVLLDCQSYRRDYQTAVRNLIEGYRLTLRNYGVEYYFHTTDEPLDRMIQSVLNSSAR